MAVKKNPAILLHAHLTGAVQYHYNKPVCSSVRTKDLFSEHEFLGEDMCDYTNQLKSFQLDEEFGMINKSLSCKANITLSGTCVNALNTYQNPNHVMLQRLVIYI